MGDAYIALCAVVATLGLMGWCGYFFLCGRLDTLSTILNAQQLVIDHLLDITKADFPSTKEHPHDHIHREPQQDR